MWFSMKTDKSSEGTEGKGGTKKGMLKAQEELFKESQERP